MGGNHNRERDREREHKRYSQGVVRVCVGVLELLYRIYSIIRYRTIHAHVETLVYLPVVTSENFNLPACQLVKCCSIARFAFEKTETETATKTEIEIEKTQKYLRKKKHR